MLAVELWGLGDVALAIPFLRAASAEARVTLLAKPHARPLLQHFAPSVEHMAFTAPWTPFTGKYRLLHWPWRELIRLRRELRARGFHCAVSARPDPRDHALLSFSGAPRRLGFARTGSRPLLTHALARPAKPHRAEHWRTVASALPCRIGSDTAPASPSAGRRVVIHTGAGHPVRAWPRERFDELARRLRNAHWDVVLLDDTLQGVDKLIATLGTASRFIGNDSGPGHIAALLGIPTFTVFGPQRPELFAPQHPASAWIDGAPCRFKPCFDTCRFAEPHCLTGISVDDVWPRLLAWLPAN